MQPIIPISSVHRKSLNRHNHQVVQQLSRSQKQLTDGVYSTSQDLSDSKFPVKPLQSSALTIGILGAGLMGRTIARVSLECGHSVILIEIDPAVRESCANDFQDCGRSLLLTDQLTALQNTDLVIEAVTEKLKVKQHLLSEVSEIVTTETVIASNTSSLSIQTLSQAITKPQRFCGLHFCHPIEERPLVEWIFSSHTCYRTCEKIPSFVHSIQKSPLILTDSPGFLVNRLLLIYLNEAILLLEEGVSKSAIEDVAMELGMSCSPFAFLDDIGIDTALRSGRPMYKQCPSRIQIPELLLELYTKRNFGRKTKGGFYCYSEFQPPEWNPLIEEFLSKKTSKQNCSKEEIELRLLLPLWIETSRLKSEAYIHDDSLIAFALQCGAGFGEECSSLSQWAEQKGAQQIAWGLKKFRPLGGRFESSEIWEFYRDSA